MRVEEPAAGRADLKNLDILRVATIQQRLDVGPAVLDGLPAERLAFHRIPTNEPWCRDHGPIFLTREKEPRVAVVDWDHNAWGGKYPPYDLDDVVPTRVAEILGLPVYYPRMILEGGSIDVNGVGALLTSEGCLLNPNRNPRLSREQNVTRADRDR